jgi:hypothetical protein
MLINVVSSKDKCEVATMHAVKPGGGAEVQLHWLIWVLDDGYWSASSPLLFTAGSYLVCLRSMCGLYGSFGELKIPFAPAKNRSTFFGKSSQWTSHCTDWAIHDVVCQY